MGVFTDIPRKVIRSIKMKIVFLLLSIFLLLTSLGEGKRRNKRNKRMKSHGTRQIGKPTVLYRSSRYCSDRASVGTSVCQKAVAYYSVSLCKEGRGSQWMKTNCCRTCRYAVIKAANR